MTKKKVKPIEGPDGQTLAYIRVATERKDGKDGVLYLHHFVTGFQELIFDTHEHAARFFTK